MKNNKNISKEDIVKIAQLSKLSINEVELENYTDHSNTLIQRNWSYK